jgi:hypothetical protein
MNIDNHRLLKDTEIIREGDIFVSIQDSNFNGKVDRSIGDTVSKWKIDGWDFYRRRHIKKTVEVEKVVKVNPPKEFKLKNVPIVNFVYNDTLRSVVVIKMDETYLKGLEITHSRSSEKREYQFKTFRRDRITDGPFLQSFGPVE